MESTGRLGRPKSALTVALPSQAACLLGVSAPYDELLPAEEVDFTPAGRGVRRPPYPAWHDARVSTPSQLTLGFLGGTGDQGRGLARRFAQAGHPVVIGSRAADRAASIAAELAAALPASAQVRGAANLEAAEIADIVVVAVPWEGHDSLLHDVAPALAGKVVIDCVNPLGFDDQGAFALVVEEGSAAQQAARLLPDSRVVAAFHHVSAVLLLDPTVDKLDTDVLVLGDDRDATDIVQALVEEIPGMRGIYAGRLRNTHQVEALTANLISINRRYKAHAGLRVTDV
jgi:NADPH-dependent F420 reductase